LIDCLLLNAQWQIFHAYSKKASLTIYRNGVRRGCDHMVVILTATYAISAYHH
jgi:hypothetical protein